MEVYQFWQSRLVSSQIPLENLFFCTSGAAVRAGNEQVSLCYFWMNLL